MLNFLYFILYLVFFIMSDKMLENRIQGKYYLFHFINNLFVTFYTYTNVLEAFYDLYNYSLYSTNIHTIIITVSLHVYHVIVYYKKLRFDDWLHHILMIIIVIPISTYLNVGSLLGFGLFFITGLPGCIDYLLLFLVRNNIIDKMVEKKINTNINLWIRCPGCIMHSTMSTVVMIQNKNTTSLFNFIF